MKKKFLTFLLAICLIIPCMFMMTACEKDKPKTLAGKTIRCCEQSINFSQNFSLHESPENYVVLTKNQARVHKLPRAKSAQACYTRRFFAVCQGADNSKNHALYACRRLKLISGDGRTARDVDDSGLNAEGLQRLDQAL